MTLKELFGTLQDVHFSIWGESIGGNDTVEYCDNLYVGDWLDDKNQIANLLPDNDYWKFPDWFPWNYEVVEVRLFSIKDDDCIYPLMDIKVYDPELGYCVEPDILGFAS